ncbi:MAG: hypothetical protein ACLQGN_30900 [Mycobacterium sp.]|uniref:hypothetical protein n=1 Tax=Mycobacterium sp. TaxID=1785 RepID=UPI003F9B006F
MKRVKVDFSTTVKDGLIRANLKRASEPLHVGDEVEAFDPAEDMEFVGVVDHLSEDGQFAFLHMQWEDNTPVPCNVPGLNMFVTSLSAVAIPVLRYQPDPETSSEKREGAFVSAVQVGPPQVRPLSLPCV